MPQIEIQLAPVGEARNRLAAEVKRLEEGARIRESRYPGWAARELGIVPDATVGNAGSYLGHRAVQYTDPYPGQTVTLVWEA